MAQQEHAAGGRSKKSKQQRKAPQRGLGVAQLEKIISEEKHKKELILGRIGLNKNDFLEAGGGGLIGPCHEIGPKSWPGPVSGNIRSQQLFHRPPPSCSSLVRSNQMELPSIQSFHCKNYFPEENKTMIGMKRPHSAFSLQSPQSSSLQSKSDELASCTNNEQYKPPMEPNNKKFRESILNSGPLSNERLNGDFLTLAPPAVASASPLLDYLGHHRHELSENECTLGQEYGESKIGGLGPSGLVENSFSFFPIKLQSYQTGAYVSGGEKGETVDLNLKL